MMKNITREIIKFCRTIFFTRGPHNGPWTFAGLSRVALACYFEALVIFLIFEIHNVLGPEMMKIRPNFCFRIVQASVFKPCPGWIGALRSSRRRHDWRCTHAINFGPRRDFSISFLRFRWRAKFILPTIIILSRFFSNVKRCPLG